MIEYIEDLPKIKKNIITQSGQTISLKAEKNLNLYSFRPEKLPHFKMTTTVIMQIRLFSTLSESNIPITSTVTTIPNNNLTEHSDKSNFEHTIEYAEIDGD